MATIKLSEHTKIVISSFKTKEGALHLNVRKFYNTEKDDEWKPTKQGITVPEEFALSFLKKAKRELDAIEDNAEEFEKPKAKRKNDSK